MSERVYDVMIAGGGVVGLACAACLTMRPARQALRVAVIEAREPSPVTADEPYALRVSAINPASQALLTAVGAWDRDALRASPFETIEVWDATSPGRIRFDAAWAQRPELGHIVENHRIADALLRCLQANDAVDWLCPARIDGVDDGADGAVDVTLDDGRRLQARILVGADGGRSKVGELAGIARREHDYGRTAVVATVRSEAHHDCTAYQRFLPDGPVALLPLSSGESSVVWSTTPERAERLVSQSPQAFGDAVGLALDGRLGQIELAGDRARFDLRFSHARAYVAGQTALIGDAAHTVHPLAGLGINLGLMDAGVLAEELLTAHGRRGLGDTRSLAAYARRRRPDNAVMLAGLNGLHRLFGSQLPPVRLARALGLALVDRTWPLKAPFMARALGIAGELPTLARVPR